MILRRVVRRMCRVTRLHVSKLRKRLIREERPAIIVTQTRQAVYPVRPVDIGSAIKDQHLEIIRQDYPHVASRIEKLWGTHTCSEYIRDLLMDSRDNSGTMRRGFSMDAARCLLALATRQDKDMELLSKEEHRGSRT